MNTETHLAHSIDMSGNRAKYDDNVKEMLADRQVLSKILKYATREFADYDEAIISNCIEGEPEVAKRPLYPGLKERITGDKTESNIPNEGKVTFDVRFHAITPGKERVKIILNVEAQKEYKVGYDFVARGIFYCSRMISEQIDTEFEAGHYNDLKKVCSIWLCMESPEEYANTISEYSIKHRDIYGTFCKEERYDLLTVVIVRISKSENDIDGNVLHKFLTVLLSDTLDVETKKQRLAAEHNMKMTKELEGGLREMCNLSERVEEKGWTRGLIEAIDNFMKTFSISLEQACAAQKITVEDYYQAKKALGLTDE